MKTIFPSIMKHKIFTTVALMGVFVVGAMAADVTGKYTGEMQGRGGPQAVTVDIKADGTTITGTYTTPRGDQKIENGKIDGDTITFTTTMTMGDNTMTTKFTGKVSGDSIEFSREMQGGRGGGGGGGRGPATFTVKKSS
jgi:hypothetical protein